NAPKSLIEVTEEEPRAMPPMDAMRRAGFIVQLVLERMILVLNPWASQHFCVYSLPRHLAILQNGRAQCETGRGGGFSWGANGRDLRGAERQILRMGLRRRRHQERVQDRL